MMPDDDLDDLRSEMSQFLEQLDAIADIPDDLLQLLRINVEGMRRIVAHYRIFGTERLYDAITKALGEAMLMKDAFKEHSDKPVVQRYFQFLLTLGRKSRVLDRLASGITISDKFLGL